MNRSVRSAVFTFISVSLIAFAAIARAQSPFDGTWHVNPASAKLDQKPFTFYTSQGWHHCVSCTPPYDIAADGQFHAVTGQSFDEQSVTIVDPHTLVIASRKDGKTISESTFTVSADSKLITVNSTNYPSNGAGPQKSTITLKRVGVLRPGVHATSGNWIPLKFTDTEADLAFTFKLNGDELTMTDPTGDNYTAKFDGNDYPYKGSFGTDAVFLKKIDAHTIVETDKYKGKIISEQKMTVSPDGRTMSLVVHDPQRDTTSTFTATKK
jgi:hypothetical protein